MVRPTVIVFARQPAIGVGKTRLARDIGRVEAWRIYKGLSAGVLRRLRDPRWRLVTRLTPDRAARRARAEPQGRGDLGCRLAAALRAHGREAVAVVGTDAPEMVAADVARLFRSIQGIGAALGPAEDGGFWGLALSARRARRVAFPSVRWSTSETLTDVERILGRSRRTRILADVDDGEDLAAWRARARRTLYRS